MPEFAYLSAEERLAEVRRRMIRDFYAGTSPESPHYWVCNVCTWVWLHGEPERHEPGCPLEVKS